MMGDPGPCPLCGHGMERRGGKDFCTCCLYLQPCCDGGECEAL
jgi:hypothetical protein